MNKGVLQKGIFLKCAFFVFIGICPTGQIFPMFNQDEEIK